MYRTADFKVSQRMFAVNLDAWSVGDRNKAGTTHTCVIAAVWFRRRRAQYNGPMRTIASAGYLKRWVEGTAPADGQDMLSRTAVYDYTADCVARWDGSNLWCLEDEETRAGYLKILAPMLEAYPEIPEGWSGWWWNG